MPTWHVPAPSMHVTEIAHVNMMAILACMFKTPTWHYDVGKTPTWHFKTPTWHFKTPTWRFKTPNMGFQNSNMVFQNSNMHVKDVNMHVTDVNIYVTDETCMLQMSTCMLQMWTCMLTCFLLHMDIQAITRNMNCLWWSTQCRTVCRKGLFNGNLATKFCWTSV